MLGQNMMFFLSYLGTRQIVVRSDVLCEIFEKIVTCRIEEKIGLVRRFCVLYCGQRIMPVLHSMLLSHLKVLELG